MAKDTRLNLRNEIIYCIYVRNHTPEGTFAAIIPDLQRIRGLGADIIWFMPIHPIGETKRKGVEGSPYAIKDYRAVNPAYGTMDDFKELAAAIHDLGMKVMIDVVYNHTSPDSRLVEQHSEWFYRRPNGEMGNKVGEWYDIVDLDYSHSDLWDYQIETLKQWLRLWTASAAMSRVSCPWTFGSAPEKKSQKSKKVSSGWPNQSTRVF